MSEKLWSVRRKADDVEVYQYWAKTPVDWAGYELADHDHIDVTPAPPPPPTPVTVYNGRRTLTQLEFLRLFTQPERVTIRVFSQGDSPYQLAVRDFMYLMELASDINLDDPETQAGVPQLEALGLLGAGRAAEILNG